MRKSLQSRFLVVALVLCTLLWGYAVAAHHHFGNDTQHCDICLLPHAADVASPLPEIQQHRLSGQAYRFNLSHYHPTHTSVYWGRGPPSLSSSV
jgi:hypothetical protein